MRATLGGLVIAFATASGAIGQETQKNQTAIKTDFSSLESIWGVKLKSFSLDFAEQKPPAGGRMVAGRITYVLEFGKDVTNYDLDALQKAFADPSKKMRHVFFDEEQIAMNSQLVYGYRIQGDLSGVKGEAFRIIVEIGPGAEFIMQYAKKLVVRPS